MTVKWFKLKFSGIEIENLFLCPGSKYSVETVNEKKEKD